MNEAVLIVYFLMLGTLAIYGVHRYFLLYLYLKNKKTTQKPEKEFETLPRVTIQLPVYNEMYVVKRLIDHTTQIDYPKDRLEIQVLDDSTDETTEIARERVDYYKEKGYDIQLIHRTNRRGFKAGALEEGMQIARGEYIAIFDADFIPQPGFLNNTIHYFTDAKIAMVQARWGHINEKFSLITKIQSIFLDGHFVIEHTARNQTGRFFNFNGTAGIWRKAAIIDAGGWHHDTLTEDLDLSYRAQLKGWKFIYLPQYVAPAELPVDIIAFKVQQHRWTKGSIQTAKKLVGSILKAKLPMKIKSESLIHLLSNFNYLIMIPFAISVFPVMMLRIELGLEQWFAIDIPIILVTTASMSFFYIFSQKNLYPNWKSKIKYLPALMSMGIGLSVNNSVAVLEAFSKKQTEFVRTPKFGIQNERKREKWHKKKYKGRRNHFISLVELILGIYYTVVVAITILEGIWGALPFLLLFQFGYLYMAFLSYHSMIKSKAKA
ncbi:MAG: glycosyltransferase family 2 protein [Candidatus Aminicenantes bacterium]|nr:MAG: glycosyltransferase family 2 protein [Candidatus Aminicenantes bacterium]